MEGLVGYKPALLGAEDDEGAGEAGDRRSHCAQAVAAVTAETLAPQVADNGLLETNETSINC